MSFSELIKNKSVAVVGNASSLLKLKKGSEIDSHDVVIRINIPGNLYYDESFEEVFGKKMDVWCFWNFDAFLSGNKELIYNKLHRGVYDENVYKIEMLNKGITYNKVETICHSNSSFLPDLKKEVITLYPFLRFARKEYNFSTGFMLTNYISKLDIESLTIYGMDFKDTPTYYNPDDSKCVRYKFDMKCGHDYKVEKKYFIDYMLKRNKKIRLVTK